MAYVSATVALLYAGACTMTATAFLKWKMQSEEKSRKKRVWRTFKTTAKAGFIYTVGTLALLSTVLYVDDELHKRDVARAYKEYQLKQVQKADSCCNQKK